MTNPFTELIVSGIIILASLLSVIFSIGIVWRAEKELDIAYKLFAVSIIAFTLGEILTLFQFEGRMLVSFSILISKLVFAICFLSGILAMRDILRRMDGEKKTSLFSPEEHNRSI